MKTIRRHDSRFLLLLPALLLLLVAAGCTGGTSAPASGADHAATPAGNDGAATPAAGADKAALPALAGGEEASKAPKEVKLDFILTTPRGESVDLKKFDGTVRVVDFWATWCPPCRLAIPHLNDLYRKYKDQGVNVVGISVDDNPKVVTALDPEIHIEYTSVMTAPAAEDAFGGIAGLPSTFVIDRQGRVYKSYVGEVEPGTLEGDVQALLAAR